MAEGADASGRPWRDGALWALAATGLLAAGFLFYVYLASLVAAGHLEDPQTARTQHALVIYARVMLVKGLLPQLWIALALWPVLGRRLLRRLGGRLGEGVGLLACAALAGLVVLPTLLLADLPGLPAVRFRDLGNALATLAETSAAVVAALWLARAWTRQRRAGGTA